MLVPVDIFEVKQIVSVRIDSGVQPVSLIIKLNHDFIDCDVIRIAPSVGCRSAFCTHRCTVIR